MDAVTNNFVVQQYAGVFALRVNGGIEASGFFANAGIWTYMDNTNYPANAKLNTSSIGTEIDEWAGYHIMKSLVVYQQLGVFFPANRYPSAMSPAPTAPGSALKFLVGTALSI